MSKMSYLKKVSNTLLTRSNLLINIFKMVWCAAVGCNNNSFKKSRDKSITFFRLPKDDSLKKKWLNNLKRANLPKIENVRICHLHFEESCFKRDLQVNCLYFL